MTSHELRAILGQLGISQVDLARLVDVTPRAVSLWMAGTRSIPGPVKAYVELLGSLPIGMQQAELAKLSEEKRSMKDGMYNISYAGQSGAGHCTLVFDGGRIYGTDLVGAKYDGEYHFNDTTCFVDVKIRVQMPANEPSVIGVIQPFEWILDVLAEMDPEKDCARINVRTNVGKSIIADYRFMRPLPAAA